jgi:Nucleotidyltransferase of unknown function (DUF6036)
MSTTATTPDLWSLVRGTPQVDPATLLAAIEVEVRRAPHDFRTRLLLRDSYRALEHRWGSEKITSQLSADASAILQPILGEDLGKPGFTTLERRLMEQTHPETILEFLRELSTNIRDSARLEIGGSSALILAGVLSRATEDIDIVDQIPRAIATQHDILSKLASQYGLLLTHFQSHYLPTDWQKRTRFLDRFGTLDVYLVDTCDIFVGKLFSAREKDRADLRILKQKLDKTQIVDRLRSAAQKLAAEPLLRSQAEKNWYILFGEPLP